MIPAAPVTWDSSWASVESTVNTFDAWYLSDLLKLDYLLPQIPQQARVLEVGCGSARLSYLLARYGHQTVGIDYSSEALRVAATNFRLSAATIHLLRGDGQQLPFAESSFDLVLSTGLLEHFDDPRPIVAEMTRVLRPGGLFFSDIVPRKFSTFRMRAYLEGSFEEDEHPYRVQEIANWLVEAGLMEQRVFAAMVLPPLGLLRRAPWFLHMLARKRGLVRSLDATALAEACGFIYLAFGRRPHLSLTLNT